MNNTLFDLIDMCVIIRKSTMNAYYFIKYRAFCYFRRNSIMTKMNKLIPLFVLPLLLTACGNSNKVEKPKFAKYGDEVTLEEFNERYRSAVTPIYSQFSTGEQHTPLNATDDFLITLKYSYEDKSEYKDNGIKEYSWGDIKASFKLDNDAKRSLGEFDVETIYEGNRKEDDPEYQANGKAKSSETLYAEVKEDDFYYASEWKKEYKHQAIPNSSYFAEMALEACMYSPSGHANTEFHLSFNVYGFTLPNSKCYINENIYTIVRHYSDSEGQEETIIVQGQYSENECSFKKYTDKKGNDSFRGKFHYLESQEYTIKKADVSVEEYDYSSYTDATLVL